MRSTKPILLVEDDNADLLIIQRALKELDIKNELITANNGEEALEQLRADTAQKPCIILLDLNMPKMNGIEFMKIIKVEDNLKNIPVIILTTSKAEQDRVETFNLGIAGYIVKPVGHDNFIDVMSKIHQYWEMSLFPENY